MRLVELPTCRLIGKTRSLEEVNNGGIVPETSRDSPSGNAAVSARRDRKHTVFEGIVPETSRNPPSGNAVGFGTKGSKTYCFRRSIDQLLFGHQIAAAVVMSVNIEVLR